MLFEDARRGQAQVGARIRRSKNVSPIAPRILPGNCGMFV